MRFVRFMLRETTGTEIAEMAAVLPVLFAVLLGIFYFGRAYNIYGTITQAAQQGARAAVATDCATCTNTVPTAAQIATQVVGPALQASHLDPAAVVPGSGIPTACDCVSGTCGVSCSATGLGSTPSICVQQNVILNAPNATQACGTAVSFQYPYNFNLPFQVFTLNLKASAQMQAENQ
jgi:TadE-like protein